MIYDITHILPAYNEARRIRETVTQAVEYFARKKWTAQIIVSADGVDGTREIVREMAQSNPHLLCIGEDARRGKGRGIREAVALASGRYIGFADADNKVPIEDFDTILPWLEKGTEVVIGSRALARSSIEKSQPLYRRIGGKTFGYVMRLLTGLSVGDTQCGFKFFPHHVAKALFSLQFVDGYMYDVEILVIATRLGYRIQEVPVRWRDDGDSRLDLVSGNIRNVRDILRTSRAHRHLSPASAPRPVTAFSAHLR